MKIVSTMGSGSLGREIDIEMLVSELEAHLDRDLKADFHSHAMVTIRLEQRGPAYTIYRTGTFQIRGAQNKDLLKDATIRFQDVLHELDISIPNFEFDQKTAVFMEDMEQEVNLETFAMSVGLEHTEYEPEQFPGLIYRPIKFDLTLTIFSNGKVIIGGTMDRDHAHAAVKHVEGKLPPGVAT